MSKLVWDETGKRFFETGTDRGVLFPMNSAGTYDAGVAWSGLTGVTESPSGADIEDLYADNMKYLSLQAAEDFGGTIEAYYYPDEWMECDGSVAVAKGVVIGQQSRKSFGLCYRTKLGNDVVGEDYGYKLHFIYNSKTTPSERSYQTVNDSPEAITFSWEFKSTPVNVTGHKPSACATVDSTQVSAEKLAALEDIVYGTEDAEARLPSIDELITMFEDTAAAG